MLSEYYRDELDKKDLALLDLLHSMLRGEPMERPSAADLFLVHGLIVESLTHLHIPPGNVGTTTFCNFDASII